MCNVPSAIDYMVSQLHLAWLIPHAVFPSAWRTRYDNTLSFSRNARMLRFENKNNSGDHRGHFPFCIHRRCSRSDCRHRNDSAVSMIDGAALIQMIGTIRHVCLFITPSPWRHAFIAIVGISTSTIKMNHRFVMNQCSTLKFLKHCFLEWLIALSVYVKS